MHRKRLCVFTFCLAFAICCFAQVDGNVKKKRILFLSSYSMGDEIVAPQIRGLTSVLPDSKYEIAFEFMDSRRFYTDYDLSVFTVYLRNKLMRLEPSECIIAGDDAALAFLLDHPEFREFEKVPLVFFGVQNPELIKKAKNNKNICGVEEHYNWESNFILIKKLLPDTKKIVFILDSSGNGKIDSEAVNYIISHNKDFDFDILNMSRLYKKEFEKQLKALTEGTVVIPLDYYLNIDGTQNPLHSTADWIASVANVPCFCVTTDLTGNGVLGGIVYKIEEGAAQAALIAKRVIAGENINSIKFIDNLSYEVVIDKNVADKYGISIKKFPLGTIIKNYEPSFLKRFWWAFLLGSMTIVFFTMAIIHLWQNVKRQRKLLQNDDEIFRSTALDSNDFIALINVPQKNISLRLGTWFLNGESIPEDQRTVLLDKLINDFAARYVDFENRSEFYKMFRLETILQKIKSSKDEKYIFSKNFLLPDGSTVIKQFTYTWLDKEKNLILVYRTDLTQSIKEEQQLNERLRKAVELAEKANEAKSHFISRISHDIRTPIGAVLNLTDFAKEDVNDTEKLLADLEKIATSGRFLLSLINDVLDISKIDSDKIELAKEPYDFDSYVNEIKNIIAPMCENKGVLYSVKSSNQLTETLLTDKIRLNQITLNLLSNSAKYTPKGGHVSFEAEALQKEKGEAVLKITVSDTGIGMSKEFQSFMFDDFSQEEENPLRSKEIQGTGLGLAIVKRIVDLMNGTISVESDLGKGSTICVSLNLKTFVEENNKATDKEDKNAKEEVSLSGKILLAEDNEINMAIAKRIFEDLGMTVDCVSNGQEEVEFFEKSSPGEYRAIFTDIQMPVMDGYEAAQKIRSLERSDAKTVPLIAMTANAFSDAVAKALQSGMSDFTTKPLDTERLRSILKNCV